ncbi:phospholipase D-like domain-containing protein [Propionivibrio limicola]|uniref:phospholipase D-like domain-containing protein n=1 Tax=Propionivibrio limicola TaxID=167645 RepID=UPI0012917EF0|nr:phospholipase D-like domain-containing protein [Propionivibrio limicola]
MGELLGQLVGFVKEYWEILDLLLVVIGLSVYVVASHTLQQRRHPSAAIAWVLGILLLPYIVLPLYLAFGSRKLAALPVERHAPQLALPSRPLLATALRSQQLGMAMGLPQPVAYGKLSIHGDGAQALESLCRMISQATRTLEVSTFILGRDAVGGDIAERLKQRARAGVKVRLLIDGVGIYLSRLPDIKGLQAAGVEVVRFVPPFRSPKRGRTNLRNHRKMVIADGACLWCGGRNLSAEYFEAGSSLRSILSGTPWVDLTFDVEGAIVDQARSLFDKDWAFATEQAAPLPQSPLLGAGVGCLAERGAQVVDSGPDRVDDTIFTLLVSACFTSQRRILAVTPYFVPEPSLLTAMTLAARRGVVVDLVLPARSNHRLADVARHRSLRDLVSAGARVWLHPAMIHAKAVVIDDELALAGSANLDGRSLFLNYEMMIAFYDNEAVRGFASWVGARLRESKPYHPVVPSLWREIAEGLILWLAFQL